MDNLLSSVQNFYLVLYTDEQNYNYFLSKYGKNYKIKIIIKPLNQFYNYQFKEFWIKNHANNPLLNTKINWELNMLWSEKVHFVHQTRISNYFPETNYYGWIDIGYFRCRPHLDIPREIIQKFPNPNKISQLNKNKIHYALVNRNNNYIYYLIDLIKNKQPIPQNQISIGGASFIGHKDKIEWWKNTYQTKLEQYIIESRVVKDDQIIIVDCVFSEATLENFELHQQITETVDPWFVFSVSLL